MRLTNITIENFRSIKKCSFKIDKFSAIVGENNSGKSAILLALNSFFNFDEEEGKFRDLSHQYSQNAITRFFFQFDNIPQKELYLNNTTSEQLIIRMSYSYKTHRRTISIKKDGFFKEVNDDFIKELSKDIMFVLIPTKRHENEFKLKENALMKKVIAEYLKIHTRSRDTLSPKVKEVTKRIEKVAFSNIAREIEKYYSTNHKFGFKLEYIEDIDYSILLNNIVFNIFEEDARFSVTECGSGVQSLSVIALYRYLANLKECKIILGVEEPEINLHPQAQRELIKTLKKDNKESQIVFTTHSSVLVDELEHDQILLVRKLKDSSRGFKSQVYQLKENFWKRNSLEEFRYYQFYKYRNSEFFFSKMVVVVESKNDAEVIKTLMQKEDIDIDLYGINIINLEGIKNIKYPFYLLKELNIPYLLIVDKDFFIPYLKDNLNASRDSKGLPLYRYKYKDESFVKELIYGRNDSERLLMLLKTNHSKALDLLEKYNIISMNYCLEMDLTCSKAAAEKYYEILRINAENKNTYNLLSTYNKSIKSINNILAVLDSIENKNLPNSYKRIKKVIKEKINEI